MKCFSCRSQTSLTVFLSVAILSLVVFTNACEEQGVVGSEIVDPGADVNIDTLKVDDYKIKSDVPVFTGNLSYLSVGHYNDDLFGEITATGVIRPSIDVADLDTLHPDAQFMLELGISTTNVYGDTTSTTELTFREMDRQWRGRAWKINSPVEVNQTVINVNPVEIGMQDSLVFRLKDSWYQKFREFYYENADTRDSLYRYEFNGFALQHKQGNKIIAIDASRTSFLVKNPDDTVATEIRLEDYGYTLDRSNVPPLPDSLDRIYSTQQQINSFDFTANRKTLGSENISRADLTFHTARDRMQSSLPANHVRPVADVFNIYLLNPDKLDLSLSGVSPQFRVQIDSTDYSFRADLTSYMNEQLFGSPPTGRRFYGMLRGNNGVIRSTLIYNSIAPKLFPKIFITSVNPDLESN